MRKWVYACVYVRACVRKHVRVHLLVLGYLCVHVGVYMCVRFRLLHWAADFGV